MKDIKKPGRGLGLCRGLVFVSAVLLIAFGIINGSADDVLTKAVNICMECIGLG